LSAAYVGAVDANGDLVTLATPDLAGDDLPEPDIAGTAVLAAARDGRGPFTVGAVGSSLRYRVLVRTDRFAGTAVLVGLPLGDVDAAVDRLVAVEVGATIAVLAVLSLVTWWVVRLGVRPIKAMTATAGAIAAGDLSHRVPEVAPGTEAGDLGVALNGMLGRIEAAFDERSRSEERLRRFVADASHELRTPVTTIRGYAELYRTGALDDRGELDEAMRRTEQEAVRMGALVDDLLHLARLDQGRPLARSAVDLVAVAADAVRDARAVDPSRPIAAAGPDGPVLVAGDEARLRQVVANLVGNALVHTDPGTAVSLRVLRPADGEAAIEVHDDGPGMAPDVAARAFERFYRADPSRSRHRGGSGLGLAIVEATVRAHGGRVELVTAPGAGATVRVVLPVLANSAGGSQLAPRFDAHTATDPPASPHTD
jgi:two-component system OmpR family sensor kinase